MNMVLVQLCLFSGTNWPYEARQPDDRACNLDSESLQEHYPAPVGLVPTPPNNFGCLQVLPHLTGTFSWFSRSSFASWQRLPSSYWTLMKLPASLKVWKSFAALKYIRAKSTPCWISLAIGWVTWASWSSEEGVKLLVSLLLFLVSRSTWMRLAGSSCPPLLSFVKGLWCVSHRGLQQQGSF